MLNRRATCEPYVPRQRHWVFWNLQEPWRKVAGRDFPTFRFSRFLHLVLGSPEANKPMLLKRAIHYLVEPVLKSALATLLYIGTVCLNTFVVRLAIFWGV